MFTDHGAPVGEFREVRKHVLIREQQACHSRYLAETQLCLVPVSDDIVIVALEVALAGIELCKCLVLRFKANDGRVFIAALPWRLAIDRVGPDINHSTSAVPAG